MMKQRIKRKAYIVVIIYSGLFFCLSIFIHSCKKLEIERIVKVETGEVSDITSNSASITGIILDVGENGLTQYGHCWSTDINPSIKDSVSSFGPINSTGTFTSKLNGLHANTWYNISAYYFSITGPYYGDEINFKTISGVPTLTTDIVTLITDTTATSGGNITNHGGNIITARGVCWSTSQNPTTNDNITIDGEGIGRFISSLTGLTDSTCYYVRAYATNSAGTAYGNQVSFMSLNKGQFTDIEGNVYNSVKIGTQVWMKENLKTTTYNDKTLIPNETDDNTWWLLTSPAYCCYNNSIAYKDTYGALYNWYTVSTNKLCPTGWHVPNDTEWNTLVTYLGGEDIAGGKMKETGILTYWFSPNTGATNESGFTALGSGQRGYSGGFASIRNAALWWSTTETDATNASFCIIFYDNTNVDIWSFEKTRGCSVRCVKDY
jgi:uncharacterized protein (TIGR02145 family)